MFKPARSDDGDRPWWRSRFVFLAGACVGLIYLFAHFASEVLERETGFFDGLVRDWVLAHRPPMVVRLFGLITRLGGWIGLAVATSATGWVLVRKGVRKRPLVVAIIPFTLSFVVFLLKGEYKINRPPAGLASALTFAFPSGHTSSSTAVAVVIGYILVRERVARRLGLLIGVAIPLLVGVSRIYLDVHWASDVLGGWMIGGAYAAGVCALYEGARRQKVRETPR